MAVPMVSFAKGVTFGGFKRRVASFRVAGVALRDIQTRCIFRGGRNTFETIIVIWRGRRSTLGVSIFILRGRTCLVARFLRIASSGLREVVTRCKFHESFEFDLGWKSFELGSDCRPSTLVH